MPAPTTLGPFLGNDKLRAIYDTVVGLDDPVGTGPFKLEIPGFKRGGTVRFFDETVDVAGRVDLAASLSIHAHGESLKDLFGTGDETSAPEGTCLADLSFKVGGSIGASATAAPSPLTISARGSLTSGIDYRHVLPVKQELKRLTALANLVRTSQSPQLVQVAGLIDGEVHRLDATLHLDFGLEVKLGRSFAFKQSLELFAGLPSADLTANGQLAIQAALGLSLYERMFLAIGRAGDRVRVRLLREHRRRLGFSAMMSLQAKYDFGGSLANVLEQALDQIRTPQLLETLKKIVDPVAAGDWEAIKASLADDLSDTLSEFLDGTGWKDWLAGSEEVQDLLAVSQEIVDFYDGIDPLIQGFWDRLLGKADLGEGSTVRRIIGRLTQMGQPGSGIEDLLDPDSDVRELVDVIETLTGKSLEEILLSSSTEADTILGRVADLGRQAEKIFAIDDTVIAKVREFAERTGIAETIEFLRQNATSITSLQGFVSKRIRRLVERLVGKAWGEIKPSDLEKVQDWAEKIKGILDAPEKFEKQLLAKIRDIQGEIGFSLSFEIERVSTTTALLDFEVERAKKFSDLHSSLEKALADGNVRDLLDVLAQEADKEKYLDQALPFLLRESAFTSRRVRTSASTFILSLLGPLGKFIEKQQGINRRIEESSVRVTQVAGAFRREGSYTGGFSRTDVWNKTTNESALWLDIRDAGTGLDVKNAYDDDDSLSRTLRVTYAREDFDTTQEELGIISGRLDDLGFGDVDLSRVPPHAQTRFSLDVRLPEEALVDFCRDLNLESAWNQDFLATSHFWFHEKLVGKRAADSPKSAHTQGEVLDAFITREPTFRSLWTKSVQEFAQEARGRVFTVIVSGNKKILIIPAMVKTGPLPSPPFRAPYDPVRELISKRGTGLRKMKKLAGSLEEARDKRAPSSYETVTRDFADAFKAASVYSSQWPTPTFGSWLLMARLSRLAPGVLSLATGVALLRWKDLGAEESEGRWQGPLVWRLGNGLVPWEV